MNATVQVRKKGQITIPIAMREKMGIEDDCVVTLSLLEGGAVVVFPRKLKMPALLDKTAAMAKKHGVTLEEMLAELDEIRHNS